jgi:hypothetical protein
VLATGQIFRLAAVALPAATVPTLAAAAPESGIVRISAVALESVIAQVSEAGEWRIALLHGQACPMQAQVSALALAPGSELASVLE